MILIDSIIELSHKMNLKVIAEGIESSEQLKIMKKLKCDRVKVCSQTSWACPEERGDGFEF